MGFMTSFGSTIRGWMGIGGDRQMRPEDTDPDKYLRNTIKMWACFLTGGILAVSGLATTVFLLSHIATGGEPVYTELRHPRQVGIFFLVVIIAVALIKRGARKRTGLKAIERNREGA